MLGKNNEEHSTFHGGDGHVEQIMVLYVEYCSSSLSHGGTHHIRSFVGIVEAENRCMFAAEIW